MNPIKLWLSAAALAAAGAGTPAAAATTTVIYEDDGDTYYEDEGWYEDTDTVVYVPAPALSINYVVGWNAPHHVHRHHHGCAHWGRPAAWHGYSHGRGHAYARGYQRGFHQGHRGHDRGHYRGRDRGSHDSRREYRHGR